MDVEMSNQELKSLSQQALGEELQKQLKLLREKNRQAKQRLVYSQPVCRCHSGSSGCCIC